MNLIISLTTHSNTYMFVAMRTMSSTHVTMATIPKNMNFKKKRGKKKTIYGLIKCGILPLLLSFDISLKIFVTVFLLPYAV